MKTIKLPIEYSNMEDLQILQEYTRLQNNIIRIAYNRFIENLSEKEIRLFLKTMNLYSESISIDSWFIQSGIYKAKEMYNKDLEFIGIGKHDWLIEIDDKLNREEVEKRLKIYSEKFENGIKKLIEEERKQILEKFVK